MTLELGGEETFTITGIDSSSLTQGDAGSINIIGNGDISTSNISSSSNQGNGGSITLESTNGNIDTTSGVIAATANNGDGGQIQINAQGNIQAGNIDSSSLTQGDAGNINITSEENITTTQITSSSEQGNGGNITINSGQGNINTTDILATSSENGGNINLTAENGAVNTSNLSSTSENGNAGNISITGNNGVNTNEINSSSDNEDAGNVTITSTSDIQISNINAEARDSGTGGQVNLTTDGFVQIDETFTNQNGDPASISTIGGNPGDEIIIDHGGEGETPFIVGDPEINGTAGSLYSSETSITPDRFFLFTENRDNIAIISVDSPQITDPGDFKNQPVTPIEQVTILPPAVQINTITEVQQILLNIGEKTGEKPALIYVRFIAPELTDKSAFDDNDLAEVEAKRTAEIDPAALPTISIPDQEKSQLQIILITPEQETVVVTVPEATFNDVIPTVEKFYEYIDEQRPEFLYLPEGQKLYQWLIAGIEPELEAREITNMLFFLPPQMRQLPIAAIHDQQTNQYLVQKYSLGLAPSFNLLVNTSYRSIKNEPALAFGTSEFTDFNPLPGVKVIIDQIEETRPVQAFVESEFTKNNLEIKYESNPYPIIFLGTHADFRPDQVEKQFVLLHDDEKLKIQDLQQFDWRNQPVELLILAACRTAIGNLESELGFSGVAFKAGVKTTLGSLWYVPDTSTSALMTEFFYQLNTVPIKAEALQQAQIAMLQGDVTVQLNQNNQIIHDIFIGKRSLTGSSVWSSKITHIFCISSLLKHYHITG